MKNLIHLDEADNVLVTPASLCSGETVSAEDHIITILEDISYGHKIALCDIKTGENLIKYGQPIGHALEDIPAGGWVHSHNLKTNLKGTSKKSILVSGLIFSATSALSKCSFSPAKLRFFRLELTKNLFARIQKQFFRGALNGKNEYEYNPVERKQKNFDFDLPDIRVYPRKNGKAGIRNGIWIIPTTGCVNSTAATIVDRFLSSGDRNGVDGVHTFTHAYGCSQLGDDHLRTKSILQNIIMNPNAREVLVLGLGCENNQIDIFRETMPEGWDEERVAFLEAQNVDNEIVEALKILESLYVKVSSDKREKGDCSDLAIGLECGGSDAFSGITANPLIGLFSDYVISRGGITVLTEVPEMFGAEHILMEQCDSRCSFDKTVKMINDFKDYYHSHNQPIYENPSPGNDIIATTALGAAGCQMVLFSTGRGNPLGGFIPTLKISSNTAL